MRVLSLCTGIAGTDIAAEWAGMRIVGQVEIDKFCIRVLEKHWPNVKRMENIYDVTGNEFGQIDLITAGWPCQPHTLQESVKELLTAVIYGRRSPGYWRTLDHDFSLERTYQGCLPQIEGISSELASKTWPHWGTLSAGVLSGLSMWERGTKETESLLLAIPNTMDGLDAKSPEASYVGVRRCLKCGPRAWYFGAEGPPHGGCPVKMQTKQPQRVDIAAALRDFKLPT